MGTSAGGLVICNLIRGIVVIAITAFVVAFGWFWGAETIISGRALNEFTISIAHENAWQILSSANSRQFAWFGDKV